MLRILVHNADFWQPMRVLFNAAYDRLAGLQAQNAKHLQQLIKQSISTLLPGPNAADPEMARFFANFVLWQPHSAAHEWQAQDAVAGKRLLLILLAHAKCDGSCTEKQACDMAAAAMLTEFECELSSGARVCLQSALHTQCARQQSGAAGTCHCGRALWDVLLARPRIKQEVLALQENAAAVVYQDIDSLATHRTVLVVILNTQKSVKTQVGGVEVTIKRSCGSDVAAPKDGLFVRLRGAGHVKAAATIGVVGHTPQALATAAALGRRWAGNNGTWPAGSAWKHKTVAHTFTDDGFRGYRTLVKDQASDLGYALPAAGERPVIQGCVACMACIEVQSAAE